MADGKPTTMLWTPDGAVAVGQQRSVEQVELRPGVIEWFRQFADVAATLDLGIHCGQCGADVIGKNADSNRVYSFTCGCRNFLGRNRDYRAPN